MKLFEYVILHHPRKKKDDQKAPKSVILKDVSRELADDEKSIGILAARQIPEDYLDRLDEVEIIVRPFA